MSSRQEEVALVDRLGFYQKVKLRLNSDKGHWREWGSDAFYLARLQIEIGELMEALAKGATPSEVWREAADGSNFLAMIADRYMKRYADEHCEGDEKMALNVLP